MRYERKEQFEKVNAFGTGTANTAYAQYFTGDSFLNPLTDPEGRRQPARGLRRDDPRQRQALARSEEGQLVQPYRRGGSRRELRERVVRAGIP